MRKVIIALLVIVSIGTACHKNNSTFDYDPCAIKATALSTDTLNGYLKKLEPTAAEYLCDGQSTGLFYKIINPGTGVAPSDNANILITYKLSYISAADTSFVTVPQSAGPVNFPLATLIDAWRKGLPLIKKSGIIHLYLAPRLGYNGEAHPGMPAYSYLFFDITLVDVQ